MSGTRASPQPVNLPTLKHRDRSLRTAEGSREGLHQITQNHYDVLIARRFLSDDVSLSKISQCSLVSHAMLTARASKHLKTHSRAFKCDFPGCTSQGFYRPRDRDRHMSSCRRAPEADRRFMCEYQDCKYATEGFPRSDNCRRHMLTQHNWPSGLETAL